MSEGDVYCITSVITQVELDRDVRGRLGAMRALRQDAFKRLRKAIAKAGATPVGRPRARWYRERGYTTEWFSLQASWDADQPDRMFEPQ